METLSMPERFWAKVKKTDDCWLWTASLTDGGHGVLWRGAKGLGNWRAAWVSVYLATGVWPKPGCYVSHTCGNKACVRPDHLKVGMPYIGCTEEVIRARPVYGSRHTNSKLTEDKVIEMRRLYGTGVHSIAALARANGVSHKTVSRIIHRHAWKHV